MVCPTFVGGRYEAQILCDKHPEDLVPAPHGRQRERRSVVLLISIPSPTQTEIDSPGAYAIPWETDWISHAGCSRPERETTLSNLTQVRPGSA